ncbi:MAG: acyl-CoA dehydrogenase family protein [Clostridiales bacterium]|nr:acyl-CoA dehydrogenase family protein [Clostridiales bacterium]
MQYRLTEYGEDILGDITAFCEREVLQQAREADHARVFPRGIYEAVSRMGLESLAVPEAYGGPGLTLQEQAAILETVAGFDAGLAVSLLANSLSWTCAERFGSETVRETAAGLLSKGPGAFCLTEEQGGSDLRLLRTAAVRCEEGYRIDGSKRFVTNGGIAGHYTVFAKTEEGLTAFLVPRSLPGITAGPEEDKLGIRNASTCEVYFDRVLVPADMVIGEPGNGKAVAAAALTAGRALCGAAAVGVAQRALDEAKAWSEERMQSAGPLSELPVVRAGLEEMEDRIREAGEKCCRALEYLEQGTEAAPAAAAAKCFAADTAVHCAEECLQIFGGNGYCEAFPAEKLLRDALVFRIIEGSNDVLRQIAERD